MLTYILFLIGILLILKAADLLVEGASSIARLLKVSNLVIGLTVVAFGTSFPELFVNIFASIRGNTGIAVGNILGSNIFNILVILGLSAIIFPLKVGKGTVRNEIPLTLLAAVLLGVMANDKFIDNSHTSALTRSDGLILLSFFIIFLCYVLSIAKSSQDNELQIPEKCHPLRKAVLMTALGFIGLGVGAKWTVAGAVKIASAMGVSESFIGLTIVAAGTSLPELATSAVAAYKKNTDIAVGNIVGSNIFNTFFILGISSILRPLPFQLKDNTDIGVSILASVLLLICMFTGKRRSLDRWEGFVLIFIYFAYVAFLIHRS